MDENPNAATLPGATKPLLLCPLITMLNADGSARFGACARERCAWWIRDGVVYDTGNCAVALIAQHVEP